MGDGNPQNRSVLATFVFASALFALFFSNAEGVTLLPFPDSTPGQNSTLKKGASKTPYNQGLTSARTTPSKRAASEAPAGSGPGLPAPAHPRLSGSVTPPSVERFDRDPLFYSGRFAGNRPGRAPPAA